MSVGVRGASQGLARDSWLQLDLAAIRRVRPGLVRPRAHALGTRTERIASGRFLIQLGLAVCIAAVETISILTDGGERSRSSSDRLQNVRHTH